MQGQLSVERNTLSFLGVIPLKRETCLKVNTQFFLNVLINFLKSKIFAITLGFFLIVAYCSSTLSVYTSSRISSQRMRYYIVQNSTAIPQPATTLRPPHSVGEGKRLINRTGATASFVSRFYRKGRTPRATTKPWVQASKNRVDID